MNEAIKDIHKTKSIGFDILIIFPIENSCSLTGFGMSFNCNLLMNILRGL